jgi:spore coat protein U-like protein
VHAADQNGRLLAARYRGKPRRGGHFRTWISALVVAAALLAPRAASAVPRCSVTISTDVLFGTYDVFATAPLDGLARLRLTCPQGVNPQITISKGNSATYAAREMRSGADVLRYNLYLDSAYQLIWGDGTEGSRAYTTPSGNAQIQIYARIPPGQDAPPGLYGDTLVVTVFL